MPRHRRAYGRAPAGAAAMLLALLAAGCARPLALQNEYFAPANRPIAEAGVEARETLSHHRALQAAQRACTDPELQRPPPPSGPDFAVAAARDALAEICATTVTPTDPVAAYGATANGYRRWVEDQVRELPAASETAASAAGG